MSRDDNPSDRDWTTVEWMVRGDEGQQVGPVSLEQIHRGMLAGKVPDDAEAARVGSLKWQLVSQLVKQPTKPGRLDATVGYDSPGTAQALEAKKRAPLDATVAYDSPGVAKALEEKKRPRLDATVAYDSPGIAEALEVKKPVRLDVTFAYDSPGMAEAPEVSKGLDATVGYDSPGMAEAPTKQPSSSPPMSPSPPQQRRSSAPPAAGRSSAPPADALSSLPKDAAAADAQAPTGPALAAFGTVMIDDPAQRPDVMSTMLLDEPAVRPANQPAARPADQPPRFDAATVMLDEAPPPAGTAGAGTHGASSGQPASSYPPPGPPPGPTPLPMSSYPPPFAAAPTAGEGHGRALMIGLSVTVALIAAAITVWFVVQQL